MVLDRELANFFKKRIYDLCEDEVDAFLDGFNKEDVLQCLLNELKYLEKLVDENQLISDELAWHLGIIFSEIAKKYSADIIAYSWFTDNVVEKGIIFDFLSGYWRQSGVDHNLDILIALSNTTENAILNDSQWNKGQINLAIDAILTGYMSCQKMIEKDIIIQKQLIEKIKQFKIYLLISYPNSSQIIEQFKNIL